MIVNPERQRQHSNSFLSHSHVIHKALLVCFLFHFITIPSEYPYRTRTFFFPEKKRENVMCWSTPSDAATDFTCSKTLVKHNRVWKITYQFTRFNDTMSCHTLNWTTTESTITFFGDFICPKIFLAQNSFGYSIVEKMHTKRRHCDNIGSSYSLSTLIVPGRADSECWIHLRSKFQPKKYGTNVILIDKWRQTMQSSSSTRRPGVHLSEIISRSLVRSFIFHFNDKIISSIIERDFHHRRKVKSHGEHSSVFRCVFFGCRDGVYVFEVRRRSIWVGMRAADCAFGCDVTTSVTSLFIFLSTNRDIKSSKAFDNGCTQHSTLSPAIDRPLPFFALSPKTFLSATAYLRRVPSTTATKTHKGSNICWFN